MATRGFWDRRRFVVQASIAGASLMASVDAAAANENRSSVCVFSKHLEHIRDYEQLAQEVRGIGFDGVDLTVREGGHVEPAKVEDDLPLACAAIRKAGLQIPMITTRISDARDPHTARILKTARSLGILVYRRGGESWGQATDPLRRIAELRPKLEELVALNREHQMFAGIHNHSGSGLGAAVWDLYELIRGFDPAYVGSNYDIGHAVAEGGYGAWVSGFRLLSSDNRIRMVAVKDFQWRKSDSGWRPRFCPLGQGMVDLKRFLTYLREIQFRGPVSLHFEYSTPGLKGAEKHADTVQNMKRDLAMFRAIAQEVKLL